MKDYGEICRISQNGEINPPSSYTNQWQRKLSGAGTFANIPGATGTTYEVQGEDQSSKLRLSQIFTNGQVLYSNELSVTTESPGCLVDYVVNGTPHINQNSAVNGDNLSLDYQMTITGQPISNRRTTWYGSPSSGGGNWVNLKREYGDVLTLFEVTEAIAKTYRILKVTQDYVGLEPNCQDDTSRDSLWCTLSYVTPKTHFNYMTVTGPSELALNTEGTWVFKHHGDVRNFTCQPALLDIAGGGISSNVVNVDERTATIKATVSHKDLDDFKVRAIFTSVDPEGTPDSPISLEADCRIQAPGYYIGNLTIVGPDFVYQGEQHQFDVNNDGNVPSTDVNYGWYGEGDGVALVASAGTSAWFRFDETGSAKYVKVMGVNAAAYDTPQEAQKQVPVALNQTPSVGVFSIDGPTDVEVGKQYEYELKWTGTAQESDISFVWIAGGGCALTNQNTTKVTATFSQIGTSFLWNQASCSSCSDSGAQMPMKDPITVSAATPTVLEPGTPHGGGYVAGIIMGTGFYGGTSSSNGMNDSGVPYYIIVSPKSGGESSEKWKTSWSSDGGGTIVRDREFGRGCTETYANSSHPLFNWVINSSSGPRRRNLGGYDDWYVPAHHELEICYRFLKPGTTMIPSSGTACCGSQGKNPFSDPISDGYTSSYPRQTTVDIFKTGGAQAFSFLNDYKSSSQYGSSGDPANEYMGRSFDRGDDRRTSKLSASSKARVIRRVKVGTTFSATLLDDPVIESTNTYFPDEVAPGDEAVTLTQAVYDDTVVLENQWQGLSVAGEWEDLDGQSLNNLIVLSWITFGYTAVRLKQVATSTEDPSWISFSYSNTVIAQPSSELPPYPAFMQGGALTQNTFSSPIKKVALTTASAVWILDNNEVHVGSKSDTNTFGGGGGGGSYATYDYVQQSDMTGVVGDPVNVAYMKGYYYLSTTEGHIYRNANPWAWTWGPVYTGTSAHVFKDFNYALSGNMFAIAETQVIYSEFGYGWQVSTGLPSSGISTEGVGNNNSNLWMVPAGTQIFRSLDFGETFTSISTPPSVSEIYYTRRSPGGGNYGNVDYHWHCLYKKTDGSYNLMTSEDDGATWEQNNSYQEIPSTWQHVHTFGIAELLIGLEGNQNVLGPIIHEVWYNPAGTFGGGGGGGSNLLNEYDPSSLILIGRNPVGGPEFRYVTPANGKGDDWIRDIKSSAGYWLVSTKEGTNWTGVI